MNEEKIAELNQQITATIFEFEAVSRKASFLEEELAKLTTPSSVEGRIARRGAVRAAVLGRDENRAEELVQRFLTEDGVDEKLCAELKELLVLE